MFDSEHNNFRPRTVCPDTIGSQSEYGSVILCLPDFEDGNTGSLSSLLHGLLRQNTHQNYQNSFTQGLADWGMTITPTLAGITVHKKQLWGATADAENATHILMH